jgi:nanoRNase/pAp phosphatase (c-di-AMP/oligoRNAs hydrolase)
MIIVTPKVTPDLDGYACALAYAEFLNKRGEEALGVCSGNPQREVMFLNNEFNLDVLTYGKDIAKQAARVVLVDASRLQGMPVGFKLEKSNLFSTNIVITLAKLSSFCASIFI